MATQDQVYDSVQAKFEALALRLRTVKQHIWIYDNYAISASTLAKFAKEPATNTAMMTYEMIEAAVTELEKRK